MAQPVLLPKLGQTVEEASIVKWHKSVGDTVKQGDVLFEIETDKAVLEAESFFDGVLLKVFVKEGETVPVSTVVAYIGAKGEKVPDAPPAPAAPKKVEPAPAPVKAAPVVEEKKAAAKVSTSAKAVAPVVSAPAPVAPVVVTEERVFISPRAKALAKAKCINFKAVSGSGPNGRITVKDIESYLENSGYNNLRISPAAKRLAAKHNIDLLTVRATGLSERIMIHDVERSIAALPKKMSKMRQIIASRLTSSFRDIPHFYITANVDMTDLLTYRQELKAQGQSFKVTDFILESTVLSLEEFKAMNSSTDGVNVSWNESVNLGLAIGLDSGLVVAAIRNSQDLTLSELSEQVASMGAKARSGKLMPDEMTGSTFTVTNMGMLNVESFGAIINPGEGGILAVASTIPTPVVRDGKVVIRQIMKITLSADHRIVDGTTGAAFINAIKNKLEDVELWKHLTS